MLGFSASSFPLFRDKDGEPRTPAAHSVSYTCSGRNHVFQRPSLSTVQAFEERGQSGCSYNADQNSVATSGQCVMKVVTPAVQAKAVQRRVEGGVRQVQHRPAGRVRDAAEVVDPCAVGEDRAQQPQPGQHSQANGLCVACHHT